MAFSHRDPSIGVTSAVPLICSRAASICSIVTVGTSALSMPAA
jgi:hypothetical protein